jgi:hypothetical protein
MTAVRFTFDGARSCVWINARSNLHPINTETRGLRGWVEATPLPDGALDLSAPVEGALELSTDGLTSGNLLYDRELRRRIDARMYPTISGQITGVAATETPGRYTVGGDLSFHGKTRSFSQEMTIHITDNTSITMVGEYVFDIREFDMKPPSMLMLKVYPEVGVMVELHGHLTDG